MLNLQNDRYFAAGVVGALVALYAVSAFTYFSNSDITLVDKGSIESSNIAVTNTAHSPDSSRLRNIMDKVQTGGVFSPLGKVETNLPGVDCKLTESTLDFSYNLRGAPANCFGVVGE